MKEIYIGFDPRSPTRSYLAHYGILGMKWGVRRFQNKDGSLTKDGKRRYETAENKKARHKPSSARKLAKQRAENLEKARLAKAEKKQFEEDKKKALESGSAADVLKYKGKLSNQELQNAFNRINLEQQLSSMAQKDVKTGWDKMDALMNKVGKVTDYSNKAISMYNVIAKVNNSFNDTKMRPIDGGTGEKNSSNKSKKDKMISEYISKYGNQNQVLSKAESMSVKELQEALERLAKDPKSRGGN